METSLLWKCCCNMLSQAMNCMGCFICVMSNVITEWQELENLCNKCPKQLIEQNSSYSDYSNVTSGFASNSRAPGGPVTLNPQRNVQTAACNAMQWIAHLSPFMHWLYHWLMKCSLCPYIVNVYWCRNSDRFLTIFTFGIQEMILTFPMFHGGG